MTPQIPDQGLPASFSIDEEWKAHYTRLKRIIRKRDAGKELTGGEKAALADYRIILTLAKPPHTRAGSIIPPVLTGYNEVAAAFGVTKEQLYGLRQAKCPAFHHNDIYTASLHVELVRNPSPKPAALNAVFTGRKGKWSKALEDSIVQALGKAPMLSIVAAAHGLDASTLTNWRTKGTKGDKKYEEFFRRTEAAIAQAKMGLLTDIAGTDDWKAKARVLEMIDCKNFGRKVSAELTGADGGPIATSGDGPPAPLIINLNGVASNPYQGLDSDDEDDEPTTPAKK